MGMQTNRPNIVMITADQMRGDCLGFLRRQHPVMTPHLDQLASEGVYFSNASATCPVCMPQRVTLLTGQVASRFGLTENFHERSPIDRGRSLPALLSRNGYQTKAVGKMHFEPDRARMGFEHVSLHPNDYVSWLEEQGWGGFYRGHGLGGNEVHPVRSAVPERYSHTHWIVDRSVDFLYERDPECPFFLWMVFEEPHSPFDPPEPFDTMYASFDVPEPRRPEWMGERMPRALERKRLAEKYDLLSDEVIREARRKYYGQISHVDYQLGRFLGQLRQTGIYEDTLIIFNSDHGEHLGDYGVFAKSTFLADSTDIPLIVRGPEVAAAARADSPAINADIVPTILDYVGIEPEIEMDGRSLMPELTGGAPSTLARDIIGEVGKEMRCASITDGEWRYIYYEDGGDEQLFSLTSDPKNMHDLVGDAEHAATRADLRRRLHEGLSRYESPLAQVNGELNVRDEPLDVTALRKQNNKGWRGPLRYGHGYGGGW